MSGRNYRFTKLFTFFEFFFFLRTQFTKHALNTGCLPLGRRKYFKSVWIIIFFYLKKCWYDKKKTVFSALSSVRGRTCALALQPCGESIIRTSPVFQVEKHKQHILRHWRYTGCPPVMFLSITIFLNEYIYASQKLIVESITTRVRTSFFLSN